MKTAVFKTSVLKTAVVLCACVFFWAGAVSPVAMPDEQPGEKTAEQVTEKIVEKVVEKTVYIPYERLRRIFEEPGRGVFLPYDEFKSLWDAARITPPDAPRPVPPIGAMLTDMSCVATVGDDVVRVEATLSLELLQDGWHEIPLRLGDVAITKAALVNVDGTEEPARVLGGSEQGGYRLLVNKKAADKAADKKSTSEEPMRLSLRLDYAKAVVKSPGRNSVAFDVPQSPMSRWRVVVGTPGVKVDFTPLVAAAEEPESSDNSDKTVLLAFAGPTPRVEIAWTPKAEGATGLEALTSVQITEQTQIDEGMMRTTVRCDYTISRAPISTLTLRVPAEQKVVSVFDPNIKKWSVINDPETTTQIIHVDLFEPATQGQSVVVELESLFSSGKTTLTIPAVEAVGVGRQQGVLAVRASEGWTLESQRSNGLLRIDEADMPESLRSVTTNGAATTWHAAYAMASSRYALDVALTPVEPHITAVTQTATRLTTNRLNTQMAVQLNIERAGIFTLSLELPRDAENVVIHGYAPGTPEGFVAAEVDTAVPAPLDEASPWRTWVVTLKRKALGKTAILVSYFQQVISADLESPTGKLVELPVVLPRLASGIAERCEGKLIVSAEEAFRINTTSTVSVNPVSLDALTRDAAWFQPTSEGPQIGFLVSDAPASLTLTAERRQPQLTLCEIRTVRISDGTIRHLAEFRYNVQFTSVKSLRIDVPEAISGRVRPADGTVSHWREQIISPQPDDVPAGYVAWSFEAKAPLYGQGILPLSWEGEMPSLTVGESRPVEVPRLIPAKQQPADRFWGQIVLIKSDSLDLSEGDGMKGLKPIDPLRDVVQQHRNPEAVAAFEYHDDWCCAVTVTRYRHEEVKRTSVEEGLVRANLVLSKLGTEIAAQALFRIRSVEQRLEITLPAEAVISDVRIDGRGIVLESSDPEHKPENNSEPAAQRRYLLPLTTVSPDTPFVLDIRYTLPPQPRRELAIPSFAPETAVQQVTLAAYVPEAWVVTGFRGDWSRCFEFLRPDSWRGASVVNNPDVHAVLASLLANNAAQRDDFTTSGTPYLFTTLRPRGDAPLALTLVTSAIGTVVCGGVVLAGLLLMLLPWMRRFQMVLALTLVAVLAGFACPTFASLAAVSSWLSYGAFFVAVCWVLEGVVKLCRTALAAFIACRQRKCNATVAATPTE